MFEVVRIFKKLFLKIVFKFLDNIFSLVSCFGMFNRVWISPWRFPADIYVELFPRISISDLSDLHRNYSEMFIKKL